MNHVSTKSLGQVLNRKKLEKDVNEWKRIEIERDRQIEDREWEIWLIRKKRIDESFGRDHHNILVYTEYSQTCVNLHCRWACPKFTSVSFSHRQHYYMYMYYI